MCCNHSDSCWFQLLGGDPCCNTCSDLPISPPVLSENCQRSQKIRGHRLIICVFSLYFFLELIVLFCVARSPVYSHISMTLQGLSTVRALKKEGIALQFFHKYQNEHTQVCADIMFNCLLFTSTQPNSLPPCSQGHGSSMVEQSHQGCGGPGADRGGWGLKGWLATPILCPFLQYKL